MSKIPHGGDARHHYLYGYAACRRAETLSPQDPSDKVWHFGVQPWRKSKIPLAGALTRHQVRQESVCKKMRTPNG